MKQTIALLFAAGLFVVMPAAAEERSREALAARLIELARLDQLTEQFKGALRSGMQTTLGQMGGPGEAEMSDQDLEQLGTIVEEEFARGMNEMLPELSAVMVDFYAERLTADELSQLVAMYELPVVDKLYDLAPEISQRSVEIALKYQKRMGERLTERLRDFRNRQQ